MDKILIRMAIPEEAGILAEIEGICFPPQEAASPEQIEERMRTFPENFVVAEADGKPVGFINGGTTDRPYLPDEMYHDASLHIPGGDYQTVFGLNVLPEYRHQGIAGELVEYFSALAEKRGKKRCGPDLQRKTYRILRKPWVSMLWGGGFFPWRG